jgi:hypothetical protein
MVQAHQVMKCVVCHPSNPISSNISRTSLGRFFFFFTFAHDIIDMKNHVVNEHVAILI